MTSKKCSNCKKTKIITNFYKMRDNDDGHQSWCKECFKELGKKYYKKNKKKAWWL